MLFIGIKKSRVETIMASMEWQVVMFRIFMVLCQITAMKEVICQKIQKGTIVAGFMLPVVFEQIGELL